MGRKSRLKRERQLQTLADRLEEGEFDQAPEAPWQTPDYAVRLGVRVFASAMGGILLLAMTGILWSGSDRGGVMWLEAVGLLFCGFQGLEARRAGRRDVARLWFVLGVAVVGFVELWHWKPEVFRAVFGDVTQT